MINLRIERQKDGLHVILPSGGHIDARPSGTGRSTVLATTEGAVDIRRVLGLPNEHSPVMLEVNLYIPNKGGV